MTIRGFADFATQFLLFQAFPNAMRRLFAGTPVNQDFFALWKDADPDIPILKQAKAEYAKLQ